MVRKNVTIDWTIRDNVRAQLRVLVKRILRKYGYPPDKQEKATRTVLEQAEVLSQVWAAAAKKQTPAIRSLRDSTRKIAEPRAPVANLPPDVRP
jgi:hypothetical protein